MTLMMTFWAMGSWAASSKNEVVDSKGVDSLGSAPTWVVDPAVPGADVPVMGASLFDRITTLADGRRDVPFPFDRLIQRFEAAAGCGAKALCVRSVLLPLGRSLQRVAASPDYFHSPRIVAGVVADGRGPWMLRDRLYVGYQERAGLIEVISYNETAGRFEFQQVKNYRAGAQPQVVQSRRTVCVACHQNHAPIFPRQVWDETNANPAVIAKLSDIGPTYFGVPVKGSTDISNALDDATDRSNRLALVQRLWSEGCGEGRRGDSCRGSALIAAVQFALTERRAFDIENQRFQAEVIATLADHSRQLWSSGLAVPNPDLPNRDPLTAATGLALAHVPAQLEPLVPRPPLEIVPAEGVRLARLLVNGIADSLPAFDIDRLNARLTSLTPKNHPRRIARGQCEARTSERIARFQCSGEVEISGSIDGDVASVDAISVGASGALRNVRVPARKNGTTISLIPKMRDQTLRLPDGNAIDSIAIDSQSVTVSVVDDFQLLRTAENAAVSGTRSHADRLASIIKGLGGESAFPPQPTLINASVIEVVKDDRSALELTAPFESRCGSCHHTTDRSPPNFLTGDARRVERALQSCAPRIFIRLAMSEVPPAQRQKTPMPPEYSMESVHEPEAVDVRLLRSRVESILQKEYGRLPTSQELLQNGYENLRPCLPENKT